jgi:hypothetical protein
MDTSISAGPSDVNAQGIATDRPRRPNTRHQFRQTRHNRPKVLTHAVFCILSNLSLHTVCANARRCDGHGLHNVQVRETRCCPLKKLCPISVGCRYRQTHEGRLVCRLVRHNRHVACQKFIQCRNLNWRGRGWWIDWTGWPRGSRRSRRCIHRKRHQDIVCPRQARRTRERSCNGILKRSARGSSAHLCRNRAFFNQG